MSIFPFISHNEEEKEVNILPTYYEVAWDYETDNIQIVNGNPVIVEGNEAIKVWCYKTLLTSRYDHYIYSWDHGSELQNLIGKPYSRNLTESEAKRYIEEALSMNPYITEVTINSCVFDGDSLNANITVNTIYEGEVNLSV